MSRDLAIFIGCTEVPQKGKVKKKKKSKWTYCLPPQHDHTGCTGRLPRLQRGDQEAYRSLGRKVTSLVPNKHPHITVRSRKNASYRTHQSCEPYLVKYLLSAMYL